MSDLAAFLGRWHPVLVHVPIGALLVAALVEALARTTRWRGARAALGPIVVFGGISAVVAAATGWLLGRTGGYAGAVFEWHQRTGILVACAALLTAVAYVVRARVMRPVVGPALLAVAVLAVTIAGHLGGTLTHGEGYLAERLPSWLGGRPRRELPARVPGDVRVFAELVQPALAQKCGTCHGPVAPAGGLRLDTGEGLKKGGRSGPAIVAGRSASSDIVRRVWLPASHKEAMPPGGRRALTAAEASLLRWWIDQGASFDVTLGDVELDASLRPAIEAVAGRLQPGAPAILTVKVPPADPAAIEKVRGLGVSVLPLAAGTTLLDVQCTNVAKTFGDSELAAVAALAPQVTRLSLARTQVTDSGLSRLSSFVNLTRLHLDRTRVTDAGLASLSGLSRLEYLNLYGTGVTDAGLTHLQRLGSLRDIYLWRTSVTAAGAGRLRSSLPKLHVDVGAPEIAEADHDARGRGPDARDPKP